MSYYWKHAGKYSVITREEELHLIEVIAKSSDSIEVMRARDRLVLGNLRLVAKIAGEYSRYGMDVDSLISAGNIGLVEATYKFNPEKKTKFSVYSSFWIRHEIKRELSRMSHAVSISSGIVNRMRHARAAVAESEGDMVNAGESCIVSGKRYSRAILEGLPEKVSMDMSLNEDGSISVIDRFSCKSEGQDVIYNKINRNIMYCMVENLNEMEKKIIKERYGLGVEKRTLEMISEDIGITHQRVQQIEKEAVGKMKDMVSEYIYQ